MLGVAFDGSLIFVEDGKPGMFGKFGVAGDATISPQSSSSSSAFGASPFRCSEFDGATGSGFNGSKGIDTGDSKAFEMGGITCSLRKLSG
jgi:hypothetical protein